MTVSLAMLLQSHPDPALSAEALVAQMRSDWPDLDVSLQRSDEEPVDSGRGREPGADELPAQFLRCGDDMISLLPIAAPIGDDIAQICEHSRLWPDSVPAPVDYAAHTIVSVIRFGEDAQEASPVELAVQLSRALASAIAVSDSIQAVYFGSADHVVFPALFRELAEATLPEPVPFAWVAVNVGERPDGVMTGYTLGMDMLGLMDLEIPETQDSAEGVFTRLSGLVDHLIENGLVIQDGDTVGQTASERIRVVYGPSALNPKRQVMCLQVEVEERTSWWRRLRLKDRT